MSMYSELVDKITMRENLIATVARRAGNMEFKNDIYIGGSVQDEDEFAAFCVEIVNAYESSIKDESWNWSFDEFIETAIKKKYQKY